MKKKLLLICLLCLFLSGFISACGDKTATPCVCDIVTSVYSADFSQLKEKTLLPGSVVNIQWLREKSASFYGTSTAPAAKLTLELFGPYPTNEELLKARTTERKAAASLEIDPTRYANQAFSNEFKLPENLAPGLYELTQLVVMGDYKDYNTVVLTIVSAADSVNK